MRSACVVQDHDCLESQDRSTRPGPAAGVYQCRAERMLRRKDTYTGYSHGDIVSSRRAQQAYATIQAQTDADKRKEMKDAGDHQELSEMALCGPLGIQRGFSRSPRHCRNEQTVMMRVGSKESEQTAHLKVGTAITEMIHSLPEITGKLYASSHLES